MPTKKQITQTHLAAYRLHNGPPPGEQHEIKMLEDPAYRAAHEGASVYNLAATRSGGRVVGQTYLTHGKNLVTIFDNEMKLAILDDDERLVGVVEYKAGRTSFTPTA